MSDEVTQQTAESLAERSVSREHYDWMVGDRDDWQQKAEALENVARRNAETLQSMIRKADHLVAERDAAQDETHKLREQYAKLHAENEGMRADALARPPEYDRTLAIERKRHSKLLDDYNLQATMIETLQEALKRTEAMLKAAQAQDIDPRLRGFLATISQLADQSQDLLP